MTTSNIRRAVAAERRELATVLGDLPLGAWDAPSLCDGWRVREVVAHITMPFRYSTRRFMVEMLKARGSFDRMADRRAHADAAALSVDDLVRTLRDNATHPWKPPGGGRDGALSHDVIHGLDITVALDLGRSVPDDRLQIVLDGMTPKRVKFFGTDLAGTELRADDLDWSYGSGEPVQGAAQDLLMVLCGRKLPPGHLRGKGSERFTTA